MGEIGFSQCIDPLTVSQPRLDLSMGVIIVDLSVSDALVGVMVDL